MNSEHAEQSQTSDQIALRVGHALSPAVAPGNCPVRITGSAPCPGPRRPGLMAQASLCPPALGNLREEGRY